MNTKKIWVIRAGKKGDAHELFMNQGYIVLQAQKMGDLRKLAKNRKAFYGAYAANHPDDGSVSVSGIGGKFFRFEHEIRVGDLIVYACIFDKMIYIGKVKGEYFFDTASNNDFPHRRQVQWKGCFPKNILSESARRELGAARTLFAIKKNLPEILQTISKKAKKL